MREEDKRMKSKLMFNWGIWMGVVMGIYALLYTLTPLASHGVMWATFVAMPVFLAGGGKKENILTNSVCGVLGVAWGVIFIKAGEMVQNAGVSAALSNFLVTLVVTIICVWVHGVILGKTPFNALPPVFGGMAATIASSIFTPDGSQLVSLAITLVLGVLAGYACMAGLLLMTEDGDWKFFLKEGKTHSSVRSE